MMVIVKRILPWFNLLLITLILYLGVKYAYSFLSFKLDSPAASVSLPIAETENSHSAIRPFSDYQAIVERNLFHTKTGDNSTTKTSSDLQLESLDQTKLKLKLWGFVVGSEDATYAVIEEESGHLQKLYKVGDSVQNATVKMIVRNKVVLSYQGKDEILEMEKSEPESSGTGNMLGQVSEPGMDTSFSAGGATIAQRRITLNREQITSAMSNLNELMGQITITQDTQSKGMSLSNIKPNSIFRRMGLRNGDVLTSVDGTSITSVDDALKLYENLKSADTTKLEITRKGKPTVIEYSIR